MYRPYGMLTDPKSKFYLRGKKGTESYWRQRDPGSFRQFEEDLEDAVKRYVSTGSYPGYPRSFIYT